MANVRLTNDFRGRAVFALVFLVVGLGIAAVGYALGTVPEAHVQRPPLYPADWMFWSIWFVLYPAMGAAAYELWRHRALSGSRRAWHWFLFGYAVNVTWVPIVHLTHSPVAAPAIMDAITGLTFLPALWHIARSNRPAFNWLLPVLIWGPITGALKIWQLELNADGFPAPTWTLLQWAVWGGALAIAAELYITWRGYQRHALN